MDERRPGQPDEHNTEARPVFFPPNYPANFMPGMTPGMPGVPAGVPGGVSGMPCFSPNFTGIPVMMYAPRAPHSPFAASPSLMQFSQLSFMPPMMPQQQFFAPQQQAYRPVLDQPRRPPRRRRSPLSLDEEDSFDTTSSSDSDVSALLEDDSSSDYESPRKRVHRRVPGRGPGRPRIHPLPVRPPAPKAKGDSDSSYESYLVKRKTGKRKPPDEELVDATFRGSSDSSGNARNKRRRPAASPEARRKRTSASNLPRVNYAQFAFDSDDASDGGQTDRVSVPSSGPVVDRVLGYRAADSPSGEASLVPVAPPSAHPTISDYVFLIKWLHTSHLHNSWVKLADLVERGWSGARKVENFYRRMEVLRAERMKMTEDELEQLDVALELQKQLDLDYLIAERIIAHKRDVPKLWDFSALPTEDAETPETDMYFVKWTSLPYDQCTWETGDLLRASGFHHLVEEYERRESRILGVESAAHPMHSHDLSQTSFEPYASTPFYLQVGHENRSLRDYQLTGINWIVSRMKKGWSVLLADEMGLGKTVQTISVIGHMMYAELITGPFLVIVPQSTSDNWLAEFRRWLPDANVVVYHGNPLARELIKTHELARVRSQNFVAEEEGSLLPGRRLAPRSRRTRLRCDVCIATPSILNNADDSEFLRSIGWYLVVIDEAHLLKNRESKRFKELALFKSRYRLLLSGTPLHNNLDEMWSLLHFLRPSAYSDIEDFKRKFCEIERTESLGELKQNQLEMLQKDLHELVLRRVKKDVEKSLPKKVERILRVEVSPMQAECCAAIMAKNYEVLAKQSGGNKPSLQNICMELKKVCNHPLLLQYDHDINELQSAQGRQEWTQVLLHSSGKMVLLDQLLQHLKEKGHRVLIFSQMVRMLNLLSRYLTLRGFRHQRLDGTMSREVRKKAMDHFNAPDSDDFCFLLSTKAGGLGINLTSADTVVIYDSDWNPQNDLQAEARAHRIGQTKTVQIYRLVTKDTIEEKILERAKEKLVLDTLVVQGLNKRNAGDSGVAGDSGISTPDAKSPPNPLSSSNGFSFSRDELAKILRFGAAKLWGGEARNEPVNLDKILAEAEERNDEGGLADQLLSSFTNISDFRYQAPPDPPSLNDKNFWETTIPLEARLKYEAAGPVASLAGKKRNGRKAVEPAKGKPAAQKTEKAVKSEGRKVNSIVKAAKRRASPEETDFSSVDDSSSDYSGYGKAKGAAKKKRKSDVKPKKKTAEIAEKKIRKKATPVKKSPGVRKSPRAAASPVGEAAEIPPVPDTVPAAVPDAVPAAVQAAVLPAAPLSPAAESPIPTRIPRRETAETGGKSDRIPKRATRQKKTRVSKIEQNASLFSPIEASDPEVKDEKPEELVDRAGDLPVERADGMEALSPHQESRETADVASVHRQVAAG